MLSFYPQIGFEKVYRLKIIYKVILGLVFLLINLVLWFNVFEYFSTLYKNKCSVFSCFKITLWYFILVLLISLFLYILVINNLYVHKDYKKYYVDTKNFM